MRSWTGCSRDCGARLSIGSSSDHLKKARDNVYIYENVPKPFECMS